MYNPCSPTLSMPSQVLSIDPNWSACVTKLFALYDPPYALQPGEGLSLMTVNGNFANPTTTSSQYGPIPAPAMAAPTRAPITAATMESGVFQFPTATFTGPLLEGPSRSSVGDLPVTNSADYPAYSPASVSTAFSVLTFVSLTITSQPNSQYPTETQTRRGPPALTISSSTISRTTVSLTPAGESALTIETDTYASTLADPTATSTPTGRLALAIGTDTYAYSINSASDHIIGSQTSTPGARVTVGSETIWLAAGATAVVIKSGTSIETVGIGAYIASGFGLAGPTSDMESPSATLMNGTAYSVMPFTGGASSLGREVWVSGCLMSICIVPFLLS